MTGRRLEQPDFAKLDEVQETLDRNREILAEIKANHDANTAESLANNIDLIQELNSNVAKVVELYNGISAEFQQYMDKRKQEGSLPG